MRARRRVVVAGVAGAACLALGVYWLAGARRVPEPPPRVAIAEPPDERPSPAAPADTSQHKSGVVNAAGLDPTAPSATPEQMFLARMDETKKALLSKHRYPAMSQPLATKTDLLLPHHVEPTIRMLGGFSDPSAPPGTAPTPGKVKIQQNQDRLYLMPGQSAIASFEALLLDSGPAPINVTRSDLTREAQPDGGAATVVANVSFHDDGNPPDVTASDGTWTGTVTPPNDGVASGMTLFVDIDSDGEKGTLAYEFIETAPPPARFTQTARDALEEGSVAFYVGIAVDTPGLYEIIARVYDSTDAPISYLRFYGQLGQDSAEVRLAVYGGLLVDEGAVPPLVLRDVEGHRMVLGQYPDREMMVDWAGGYTSAKYDISQFTTKPYVDPQKQAQLSALDKATADGLANVRSQGAAATTPAAPGPPSTPPAPAP